MKLRFFVILFAAGCSSQPALPPTSNVDARTSTDLAVVDGPSTDDVTPDVADAARDAGSDGGADAASDAASDAAPDVPTDAAPDAQVDAALDTATDAVLDTATDAVFDSATDAATDRASDTADAVVDTGAAFDALTDAPASDGGWMPFPGATCNARERNVAVQESPHVEPDAGAVTYLTNPPASGPHFPVWTRWGAWPAVPRGHWVHNLEHGGVVYLYRCPAGTCDATRDAIVSAANALPTDPACMPTDAEPARVRVVITSDNEITTPIAAAAWGWLYAADCVDAASLREFYRRHAGMAPEDFCFEGAYP